MRVWAVLLAMALFVLHSSLFWTWIVDDAGISFAYARNLANGFGLVSQPGLERVEGYSNPLWVGLLTPVMLLGLFDPIVTPKVLSIILIAASFVVLYRTLELAVEGNARWLPLLLALPLLLLALDTSFVVWTTSGLENPLSVLELSLMLYLAMRVVVLQELTWQNVAALGVIAAATAMTRPDGVLLAIAPPLLLLFGLQAPRLLQARLCAAYALAFLAPMAAFLALRLAYFGELYPNTYYAKGGLSTSLLFPKADDLLDSVVGFDLVVVQALLVAVVVAGIFLLRRPALWVAGVFLATSAIGVLLLPQDWMRENRFCTLFAVTFYVVLGLEATYLLVSYRDRLQGRALAAAVLASATVAVISAGLFIDRSVAFSEGPTVPLSEVKGYFGERFERYAAEAEVEDPSLLTLDIGGVLYYSVDMRVYDLVGLTDKTIARTLQDDQGAFHDYVLEDLKPTFIHTHGIYAVYAALDLDSRFRQQYRPICEQIDPWIERVWRFYWYSGDYVRWDVAEDDALVAEMAKDCQETLPYASN